MLDMIGSMTENAILRSVKFNKERDMTGGGLDNRPPIKLPPADANLSQYCAIFPSYQLDNGNMLEPNPMFGEAIFSGDYRLYPDTVKLWANPGLPPYDKEYSTDNNSSTDDSMEFESSTDEDNEQQQDNDSSDNSYM